MTPTRPPRRGPRIVLILAVALVGVVLAIRLDFLAHPDPTLRPAGSSVAAVDIAVLVFREGLECILVLAAITANMVGPRADCRRPVAAGAAIGFVATLVTWRIAAGIIDDLAVSVPALNLQALTGLLAILVLLVVMNWFFHKVYWTGWITLHTNRKRELMSAAAGDARATSRLWWGLGLLGFTSLYREGFEIVLFLQSYRLKLGSGPLLSGVLGGLLCTAVVAVLTFLAHRRLPYRQMLVITGSLLGVVLLVMVGEQAQEMQLARWLPTTEIGWLSRWIPDWMRLWFSVFPTVETLGAQALAALIVLGSYLVARDQVHVRLRTS
jgi:high-affinity iron transporter